MIVNALPFEPGDLVKIINAPNEMRPEPLPKPGNEGFPEAGTHILIFRTSFEGGNRNQEIWSIDYIHNGREFNIIEPRYVIDTFLKKVEI